MYPFRQFVGTWVLLGILLPCCYAHSRSLLGKLTREGKLTFNTKMTRVTLKEDSGHFFCFPYRVKCVEYQFDVAPRARNLDPEKIMVFVAASEDVRQAVQNNMTEIDIVEGSKTIGHRGDTGKIKVGTDKDFCVVLINKVFDKPAFREPYQGPLDIQIKVQGCPTTSQKIVALTVPIIIIILLSACFSAWWVRRRRIKRAQSLQDSHPPPMQSPPQGIMHPPQGTPQPLPQGYPAAMHQQQMAGFAARPPRGPPPMMVANIDPSMGATVGQVPAQQAQPMPGPQNTTPWTVGGAQNSTVRPDSGAYLPRF